MFVLGFTWPIWFLGFLIKIRASISSVSGNFTLYPYIWTFTPTNYQKFQFYPFYFSPSPSIFMCSPTHGIPSTCFPENYLKHFRYAMFVTSYAQRTSWIFCEANKKKVVFKFLNWISYKLTTIYSYSSAILYRKLYHNLSHISRSNKYDCKIWRN